MRGKTGADREISVNTYTGGFTTMLNHHKAQMLHDIYRELV